MSASPNEVPPRTRDTLVQTERPVVACKDLFKSCWMQGDPYKTYQSVYPATKTVKPNSPFNPSNFQPASVFLRDSVTKPITSVSELNFRRDDNTRDSGIRLESDLGCEYLNTDNHEEFDRNYEAELRRNASLSLGKHATLPSRKLSSNSSCHSYTTQYRPPSSVSTNLKNDIKKIDYLKQHLLRSSPTASMGSGSPPESMKSTPTKVEFNLNTPPAPLKSILKTTQDSTHPMGYNTLPLKPKNKPRPLRSGTLKRHKSSAEIYSNTNNKNDGNNPATSQSSLDRLLSKSADDIRRSLRETNGVLQRLLRKGDRRKSVDNSSEMFSCRLAGG